MWILTSYHSVNLMLSVIVHLSSLLLISINKSALQRTVPILIEYFRTIPRTLCYPITTTKGFRVLLDFEPSTTSIPPRTCRKLQQPKYLSITAPPLRLTANLPLAWTQLP